MSDRCISSPMIVPAQPDTTFCRRISHTEYASLPTSFYTNSFIFVVKKLAWVFSISLILKNHSRQKRRFRAGLRFDIFHAIPPVGIICILISYKKLTRRWDSQTWLDDIGGDMPDSHVWPPPSCLFGYQESHSHTPVREICSERIIPLALDDLRDFWWVSCRMTRLQYGAKISPKS